MSRARHPRRNAILAAILAGGRLKDIADAGGMTIQGASKWASALGFRRFWITDNERRAILRERAQKQIQFPHSQFPAA